MCDKYNGWSNRIMIDLYLKYCQVLFERYKGKVKYWITFNEINSILHQPFVSGAILTPKAQLSNQQLYQAIHYELVASAKAYLSALNKLESAQNRIKAQGDI